MINNSRIFEYSFLTELSGIKGIIVGIDEVGRGALFGLLVASAIALPLCLIPELINIGVKDSKQLSAKQRAILVTKIKEIVSHWAIASASVEEIQASLLAMKRAILQLNITPELCLIDGNQTIPDLNIKQITIIKGDRQSSLIGAASILAKVFRDNLITNQAKKEPEYDLLAIKEYGLTSEHRRSFAPSPQLSLF